MPSIVEGLTFELQAHREQSCLAGSFESRVTTNFTESLILAQDERWRRA